jgi:hypothetical protein
MLGLGLPNLYQIGIEQPEEQRCLQEKEIQPFGGHYRSFSSGGVPTDKKDPDSTGILHNFQMAWIFCRCDTLSDHCGRTNIQLEEYSHQHGLPR